MDTTTTEAFFEELEKISEALHVPGEYGAKGISIPRSSIVSMSKRYGLPEERVREGVLAARSHGHYPFGSSKPKQMSFIRENLSEDAKDFRKTGAADDNKITKDRVKRFVQYGLAGAAGSGLGYAAGKAVGRPLQKKLRQWGAGPKAAKFLRYAVPTTAGLGAGLALTKGMATSEFLKKVKDGEKGKKPVLPKH